MDTDPSLSDAKPWHRQDGEGDSAFAAFQVYRDLPGLDRGGKEVAQKCHRSLSLIFRWMRKWRWADRLRAWEAEQDRVYCEELRAQRREAAKRHVQLGRALQALAAQGVNRLNAAAQDPDPKKGPDLKAIASAMRVGVMLEQNALAMPTDRTVVQVGDAAPSREEAVDAEAILNDPELIEQAEELNRLIEDRRGKAREGAVEADPGGARSARQRGPVAPRPTPRLRVRARSSGDRTRRGTPHRGDAPPPREE